jgi:hypothetical protein
MMDPPLVTAVTKEYAQRFDALTASIDRGKSRQGG